jgi:hypothetical protein
LHFDAVLLILVQIYNSACKTCGQNPHSISFYKNTGLNFNIDLFSLFSAMSLINSTVTINDYHVTMVTAGQGFMVIATIDMTEMEG